MIKTITFTHTFSGEQYIVEVEYVESPPTVPSVHRASCPTDYLGERDILDAKVYTLDGEDVSDVVPLTDEEIWGHIDICGEVCNYEEDMNGLTMKHIADERWFYDENNLM